jgi:DNA-binding NarL/FixJ family response regulator
MGTPRILVVEGHPLFRRGLVAFLEAEGFAVVGTAAGAASALEGALRTRPDLVLMDLELEDGSGVEATRAIVGALGLATRVVVLADSGDRDDMLVALRAGAVGYLGRSDARERLAVTLRGVLRGEAAVSRRMAAHLVEQLRHAEVAPPPPSPRREPLTPRQLEILRLIARGSTTGEIAQALYLSPETVRWHVKAILRRLKARTRAEAAAVLHEVSA